jgi:chromate transporter
MEQPALLAEDGGAQRRLREFVLYFLRLGAFGFGGPIALAGHMQKDLVEERKWISSQDYLEGLAFAQLSPGPLAAQLAMYLGWVRAGPVGGTLTGVAFVLPSFLLVIVLASLYVHYGPLSWIQGAFYGIGAAVIAIIVRSAYKLVCLTLKDDWLLWGLFAVLAVTTAWKESEIVWLFLLCGVVSMFIKAPPRFTLTPCSVLEHFHSCCIPYPQ